MTLHHEMLCFIYNNQALAESKLAYMWNRFKETNDTNKNAEELKILFNCTILVNINDYDQLDGEQKKYFEIVDLLDTDETEQILIHNEPQVGKDYKLISENDEDSTDSELDDANLEKLIKDKLKNKKTYHGKFENDLFDKHDDYVLKIKKQSANEKYEDEDDVMQHELAVIFSALLTTNEERENCIQISQKEIFKRLQTNRNLFANPPSYFRNSRKSGDLQEPTLHATISEQSTVSLPNIPASSSSSSDPEPILTQNITSSTPNESQPSTSKESRDIIQKTSKPSTSVYAVPKIKTKEALVPNPKTNPRMAMFVEQFKSKKRPRRSSLSPSPPK